MIEPHYTVREVAERLKLAESTVRSLFSGLPGVVAIERPRLRHKRAYTTLRISESALRGWYERHSAGAAPEFQPIRSGVEKPLVRGRKRGVEAFSGADRGVA
jgi:hypothetical protein